MLRADLRITAVTGCTYGRDQTINLPVIGAATPAPQLELSGLASGRRNPSGVKVKRSTSALIGVTSTCRGKLQRCFKRSPSCPHAGFSCTYLSSGATFQSARRPTLRRQIQSRPPAKSSDRSSNSGIDPFWSGYKCSSSSTLESPTASCLILSNPRDCN